MQALFRCRPLAKPIMFASRGKPKRRKRIAPYTKPIAAPANLGHGVAGSILVRGRRHGWIYE